MKIFAFVDLHENLSTFRRIQDKVRNENPDLIVCAGDFTVFEQHINEMTNKISELGTVLLIHGNHETESITRKLCEKKNIIFLHKRIKVIDDYAFIGHGGGGFSIVDKEFERFIESIKKKIKGKKIILVTHAPASGTRVDYLHKEYCGNKSYARFIKSNNNVILNICGHLHETAKKRGVLNQAIIINPGPDGEIIKI